MDKSIVVQSIRQKYDAVHEVLHERGRRIWAASEAQQLGWGGISLVEKAIGMSHTTIRRGLREIQSGKVKNLSPEQSRLEGGGRKKLTEHYTDLPDALEALIDPVMRGDPESPLRWTCKSTRLLAHELNRQGYDIGSTCVRFLLHELEYSLQGNKKTREGADATRLLITADSGGSTGYSHRLWKTELQKLANFMGLNITVCHFPPGTSKWNKIEHRLFSFITQNWRGQPLYDLVTVVNLISNTTTSQGLVIKSAVDTKVYPKGIIVSDDELKKVKLKPHDFHGEWNYTVKK